MATRTSEDGRPPEDQEVDPDLERRRQQRRQELTYLRRDAEVAHEAHLQARADAVRAKAKAKAARIMTKAEIKASRIEGIPDMEIERKVRLDVHGRPKPLLRGWIHAVAAPLALAAGIVLICLAHGTGLKLACAVFMIASLALFGNSALYHLGDWTPGTTDVLRRLDHVNIFLLIAGTYTPISFALDPFWRRIIILGMWGASLVAMIVHVFWIEAPRWLYTLVYVVFGVSGVGFLKLFWAVWPTSWEQWSTACADRTPGPGYSVFTRSSTAARSSATPVISWPSTWWSATCAERLANPMHFQ